MKYRDNPGGDVTMIVHQPLDRGDLTNQQVADEVRKRIPGAATSAKSVASLKSEWKRHRGLG